MYFIFCNYSQLLNQIFRGLNCNVMDAVYTGTSDSFGEHSKNEIFLFIKVNTLSASILGWIFLVVGPQIFRKL